jgi:hypothetical protein
MLTYAGSRPRNSSRHDTSRRGRSGCPLPLYGSGIERGEGSGERGKERERAEKRERVREGEIEGRKLGRRCLILMLP